MSREDSTNDANDEDGEDVPGYSGLMVAVSAAVGLIVAFLVLAWAAGSAVFYEDLFRVAPTVDRGGIGTDWAVGNTMPVLDFAIALVHAADVLLGLFIILIFFVHWASFRRLAAEMRQSADSDREIVTREDVTTDGGRAEGTGARSQETDTGHGGEAR